MAKGFNIVDYVLAQAADSPVKKFDGGGGVDGSGSIVGQIFAQQPTGGMNFGPSSNSMLGGSSPLGGVGFSSGALDSTYAELDPGLDPAMTEEEKQIEAAQAYIDAVAVYMDGNKPQTIAKVDLDNAKQALVDLGVSRNQIESVTNPKFPEGIDASRGISGVMGPSVGGALGSVADTVIDKYGTGALKALDAYTSLFGYDADELLKDSSVAFNPLAPGATYIFGEDGKVRTTPLGTTSAGNPVVLSGPIGAAGSVIGDLARGDIGIAGIPGAIVDAVGGPVGAIQTIAGALNVADDNQTKDKVTLDTTGIAGSLLGDKDKTTTTTTTPTSDTGNVATKTDTLTPPSKDRVLLPDPTVTKERVLLPDPTAQDLDVAEIIRTNAGTDVAVTPAVAPEIKTSASPAGGGSSNGGSGLPAGGGGIAEIAGEPGELVEIQNYIDMTDSLDAMIAQMTQEEEEDELPDYPYSGGGAVKRFSGTAGSAVSAYPPASLVPEEDGGTMKTGKSIFQKGLPALIGAGLGAAFGLTDKDDPNPSGYQGGIPEYKYNRSLVPGIFDPSDRRPGSAGRSYFTQGAYDPTMETVDGVEVQSTLGGAQRRADAVDAATQQATQDALYQQIYDDFVALQPGDDTPGSGSMEAAAGMGAAQDVAAAATPAPTPISATPTGGGTPIPSDITFSPEVTAEDFAIGAATGPLQEPTPLESYNAIAVDDDYSPEEVDLVTSLISSEDIQIPDVAGRFNVSTGDIVEDLLRNQGFTPPQVVNLLQPTNPNITEETLMVELLLGGHTTPEEVATYYQTQFPGITPEQVSANLTQYTDTQTLAQGGMLQGNGYYLGGTTDGMADQIPATIDNSQPAALSDGEFVVPADVVSHLGNGNSEAGATQLYSMMDRVRKKRTGTVKQGTEINPMQQLPA